MTKSLNQHQNYVQRLTIVLHLMNFNNIQYMITCIKGLSQIVPGARTAHKNYYLSHIILLTVWALGTIFDSSKHVLNFIACIWDCITSIIQCCVM